LVNLGELPLDVQPLLAQLHLTDRGPFLGDPLLDLGTPLLEGRPGACRHLRCPQRRQVSRDRGRFGSPLASFPLGPPPYAAPSLSHPSAGRMSTTLHQIGGYGSQQSQGANVTVPPRRRWVPREESRGALRLRGSPRGKRARRQRRNHRLQRRHTAHLALPPMLCQTPGL
jgi:hypothetical protein